jgi:hypothetical protein
MPKIGSKDPRSHWRSTSAKYRGGNSGIAAFLFHRVAIQFSPDQTICSCGFLPTQTIQFATRTVLNICILALRPPVNPAAGAGAVQRSRRGRRRG